MIIRRIFIFIALLIAINIPAVAARAQTAPDVLVRDRCTSVKLLLDQQRRRDIVTRINRGRAYQTIIDQMRALGDRVRNNQMNTQPFEQQQAALTAQFETFRSAFTAYDDALGVLLGMDCTDKPVEFLVQLAKVRQLRSDVGVQVNQVKTTLVRYREIVVNLQAELERLRNAVLGERQ